MHQEFCRTAGAVCARHQHQVLELLGIAALPDGTGNALDNTILGNPGNNTLDGGTGIDTVRLVGFLGANASLDLTAIANVGAGSPAGLSRIEGIEKFDLVSGSGSATLTLATRDVVDMSGMNVFNSTAAGGSVTGLGPTPDLAVLVEDITPDPNDTAAT